MKRTCLLCKKTKPFTKKHFRHSRVYKGKVYLTRKCKTCTPNYSDNTKRYQRNHPERFWITKTVTCAMRRAKTSQIPFDREAVRTLAERYKHGSPCPSCNTSMTYFNNGKRHTWASLDRINSRLGYVFGNLSFICYRCNLLKSNATISELENIIRYMKLNNIVI